MKTKFDHVSSACSKFTTKTYSSSFSLGILLLHKNLRNSIYNIYGFVRFADEIVDSFHSYNKEYLLEKFRNDTIDAIEQEISLNPILNSFQAVVHKYNIDWELIDCFLRSMKMDLDKKAHTVRSYEEYICGSAEVVGLMCLKVFTEAEDKEYNRLKPFAMKLGAAFQKINFLRDLKDDFSVLGRMYFPGVNFNEFSKNEKRKIEDDIENDFRIALQGIKQLPASSKAGVYLAYFYYYQLFIKIKKIDAKNILNTRIRIMDINKLYLILGSMIRVRLNLY